MSPVQHWVGAPDSRPEKPKPFLISAKVGGACDSCVLPNSIKRLSLGVTSSGQPLQSSLAVPSLTLLSDWVLFLAQLWGCWVTWGKSFLLGKRGVVLAAALGVHKDGL